MSTHNTKLSYNAKYNTVEYIKLKNLQRCILDLDRILYLYCISLIQLQRSTEISLETVGLENELETSTYLNYVCGSLNLLPLLCCIGMTRIFGHSLIGFRGGFDGRDMFLEVPRTSCLERLNCENSCYKWNKNKTV